MEQYRHFCAIFEDVFQKNQLDNYITDGFLKKFYQLTEIMLETNKVMNVTALTTIEKIIPLHYADCVLAAQYIPKDSRVIDIGCGGGFPILPLAIVRPDLELTGLDSTDKKIKYVQSTAKKLKLPIQIVSGRAEEISRESAYREIYDVAISRAVARMNVLNELALPFVKVDGLFIAMKGAIGQEEALESVAGCKKLGGKITKTTDYSLRLQDETEKRTIVSVRKTEKTPIEYPRSFGNIKKKPL